MHNLKKIKTSVYQSIKFRLKIYMKRFCPTCNLETNRSILDTETNHRAVEYFAKESNGKIKDRFYSIHMDVINVSKCLGCDSLSLTIDEYRPDSTEESYILGLAEEIEKFGECKSLKFINTQTYPPKTKIEIPNWVKELHKDIMILAFEVYRAYSLGLYSLTSMGIRTLIDSIATIKVGDIGGFEKKMKKLHSDGYISQIEHDMLISVVEVGHASSHRSYKPNEEEIKTCLNLLNHVMETEQLSETAKNLKQKTPKRFDK